MSALTLTLATALVLTIVAPAPAQVDSTRRADSTRADTIKPPRKPANLGPLRTIEFDTDEGTWMNLDVCPLARFFWMTDAEAKRYAPGEASALGNSRDRSVAPGGQTGRPRQ